jgi:hypothetical protein
MLDHFFFSDWKTNMSFKIVFEAFSVLNPCLYQSRKVSGQVFVFEVLILPHFTIFLLVFGTVPTAWYFFSFSVD